MDDVDINKCLAIPGASPILECGCVRTSRHLKRVMRRAGRSGATVQMLGMGFIKGAATTRMAKVNTAHSPGTRLPSHTLSPLPGQPFAFAYIISHLITSVYPPPRAHTKILSLHGQSF